MSFQYIQLLVIQQASPQLHNIAHDMYMYTGLHLGGGRGGRWPPLGRISPPLGIVSLLYILTMSHGRICIATSASKTPIPQYNLSVKVVPENTPDSISDSLKTKISWGGMPPDPPTGHVLSHTHLWLAPPIFIKLYFCPPLQHFLNEGLVQYDIVRYL